MGKGLTRGDQRDRRGARRSGDRLKLVGSGGAVDPPFPGRALMVAIEDQIVPRLVLAHSVAPALGRAKTRSSDSAGPLPTDAAAHSEDTEGQGSRRDRPRGGGDGPASLV